MTPVKTLARAGYWVAGVLCVFPIADIVAAMWPAAALADEHWRFGAVGTLSQAMVLPLLGLFLAIGIALLAEHRRTRITLARLCTVLAVLLTVAALGFVLDYFQVRANRELTVHDGVVLLSLAKQLVAIVVLVLLGRLAREPRAPAMSPSRRAQLAQSLVMPDASPSESSAT